MDTKITTKKIVKILKEELDDNEIYDLYRATINGDIYMMDDFEDIVDYEKLSKILGRIDYANFNPEHEYFVITRYGLYRTFNDITDEIDIEDLAEAISGDYGALQMLMAYDTDGIFYENDDDEEEEREA